MEDTPSFVRKSLRLELEISSDWIDYCIKHNDLFFSSCIGYWAYGISVADGWLVFDTEHGAERQDIEAERAYLSGAPLPDGYYLINQELTIRAWEEGVKLYGLDWYNSGKTDATTYDVIIQKALFGDVKYG